MYSVRPVPSVRKVPSAPVVVWMVTADPVAADAGVVAALAAWLVEAAGEPVDAVEPPPDDPELLQAATTRAPATAIAAIARWRPRPASAPRPGRSPTSLGCAFHASLRRCSRECGHALTTHHGPGRFRRTDESAHVVDVSVRTGTHGHKPPGPIRIGRSARIRRDHVAKIRHRPSIRGSRRTGCGRTPIGGSPSSRPQGDVDPRDYRFAGDDLPDKRASPVRYDRHPLLRALPRHPRRPTGLRRPR